MMKQPRLLDEEALTRDSEPLIRRRDTKSIFPSRVDLFARMTQAIQADEARLATLIGPIGSGKSWLITQLTQQMLPFHWTVCELSPGLRASAWVQRLASTLGLGYELERYRTDEQLRNVIKGYLSELRESDRSPCLIVDRAHYLVPELAEELITWVEDSPDTGFAKLILTGEPKLIHQFRDRAWSAMAARLTDRWTISAVTLDDLLWWTQRSGDSQISPAILSEFIATFAPNVRAIVQAMTASDFPRISASDEVAHPREDECEESASHLSGPTMSTFAPLRREQGLVEFGWFDHGGSSDASALQPDVEPTPRREFSVTGNTESDPIESESEQVEPNIPRVADEPVSATIVGESVSASSELQPNEPREFVLDDRYTTLQARQEWSRNRQRIGAESSGDSAAIDQRSQIESGSPSKTIWSEPGQTHGPYNPWGTRPRSSHEAD